MTSGPHIHRSTEHASSEDWRETCDYLVRTYLCASTRTPKCISFDSFDAITGLIIGGETGMRSNESSDGTNNHLVSNGGAFFKCVLLRIGPCHHASTASTWISFSLGSVLDSEHTVAGKYN